MNRLKFMRILLLLLTLPMFVHGQSRRQIDSAYAILEAAVNDTVRMGAYSLLGGFYDDINADSGLYYCHKGIAIAERFDYQLNKAMMLAYMSWPLMKTGNYPEALKVISQGLQIAEDASNMKRAGYLADGLSVQEYQRIVIGLLYTALESLYLYVGDYEKQIAVAHEAITRLRLAKDSFNLAGIYPDLGDSFLKLNKPDSALYYQQIALDWYAKLPFEVRKFEGAVYSSIGNIYEHQGAVELARKNYQKAIEVSEQRGNPRHTGNASLQLANLFQGLNEPDSSFMYSTQALHAFTQGGYKKEVAIAYRMISDYYQSQNNTDSSFAYLRLATYMNDSLDNLEKQKLQQFRVTAFNEQLALQQKEQERVEKEGRLKTMAIIALIAVFSVIGFLLYRNNRQKQNANLVLQQKNNQIERTLRDLKATQSQLIQSEKMASLGELTAGIAHEIQNPLNFVNNFSEVNTELLEELLGERIKEKGERDETVESELLQDIRENELKINLHGKRADAIVKSMLQHSRTSKGEKELTDINDLCNEYLRLAYFGFKARNSGFEAKLKTEFDPELPLKNIVPQDIGRVLQNILNNAFSAVAAVKNPEVLVSTRLLDGRIEITITDNGPGIPENIKDKIFQPFFTTKPTGQGTGLGLSMAYDIVKAHGGEIGWRVRAGEELNLRFD